MSFLEHGQACTGWFDRIGTCDWEFACRRHDKLYMTPRGRNLTRCKADLVLARGVWKVCKPMAFIMFIGVRITGLYYWTKYEEQRNG